MNEWKTIEKDGLPPVGVGLIATVKSLVSEKKYELAFPVYYCKNHATGSWGWLCAEHGFLDMYYQEIVAWMEIPKPYKEEKAE